MKFHDVIMGWKDMDTLHMGNPSTKEHVRNVDEVESIIKAKNKYMVKIKAYTDIVIVDKPQGTIVSEIGRYDVSTNFAVTNDII